jgi:16S rRNA (adenine1518-N6/adenine1519-N6)-dimethyltransferase
VIELLTPAGIRDSLHAHGLRPSRALGQHFLADPNTARRIVRLARVGPGDVVVEVGPGLGSLTLALVEAGARVVCVERDRHVLPALRANLPEGAPVEIVEGDALDIAWDRLAGGSRVALVANLPYNVAVPVVVRALETAPRIDRGLVMVQREVGERLAASPGTKAYGAVSVKVAYHAAAELAGSVPATVFVPRPRVESTLVRLTRHAAPPVSVADPERMFAVVRAGFAQRRKMLRSSLRAVLGAATSETIERAGLSPSARAEELALADWAALADAASRV